MHCICVIFWRAVWRLRKLSIVFAFRPAVISTSTCSCSPLIPPSAFPAILPLLSIGEDATQAKKATTPAQPNDNGRNALQVWSGIPARHSGKALRC
ncbi:hypothetical protein C8R45DRAFT_1216834 [Mycena sanguinolenta]|nr:hypothetical protein C8R45DRAFT_1216834 [Mycena sanguinolenta]